MATEIETTKASQLEELTSVTDSNYIVVTDGAVSKKVKATLLSGFTTEEKNEFNNSINIINEQLDTNTKQLDNKINEVANTGTTIETVQNKVEEMAQQGLIQAYTLGDKTVEPRKTTFMEDVNTSSNLFNCEVVTLGKYLSASSGEEREGIEYFYSDFIGVDSEYNYTATECYNAIITYYNSNKEFVSGLSIGNNQNGKTITIPSDVKFLKLSLRYINTPNSNYDYTKFAICKGDTATYEPYGLKTKIKDEYVQDILNDIMELKNPNKNNNYIVVAKKGGDYNNLTEAVLNSNTGDVILLMPGIYENEVVEAWGKTIYVIGISKTDCIIKNSTGAYHTPPLEASSGLFKNLSIIHEKNSNTTGVNGYAIHIEDNDTANKNLVFENCYIESQNNWAIGMGMRGGCYVEFNKCDLVGNDNSHGGLFFHDSNEDEYLGEQTIRCIDTNIFSIGTNTSDLKIQSQCKDGSTVNVEFIRTNVRNLTNGKQTKVFLNDNNGVYTNVTNIEDLTNFNLSKGSYGNSMEILNY